jgi:hypothetical protein
MKIAPIAWGLVGVVLGFGLSIAFWPRPVSVDSGTQSPPEPIVYIVPTLVPMPARDNAASSLPEQDIPLDKIVGVGFGKPVKYIPELLQDLRFQATRQDLLKYLRQHGGVQAFFVAGDDVYAAIEDTWRVLAAYRSDTSVTLNERDGNPEMPWLYLSLGHADDLPAWVLRRVVVRARDIRVLYGVVPRDILDVDRRFTTHAHACWIPLNQRTSGCYRIQLINADDQSETLARTITVKVQ